ncbi:MAG: galactokinase [Candidatus Dormibacteria bacterium]
MTRSSSVPALPEAAERASALYRARHGEGPHKVAWAPGRVNLLGEHVDYAGGNVLPFAVDRHVAVAARTLPRPVLDVHADGFGDLSWEVGGAPPGGFGAYVAGVALVLEGEGYGVPGLRAVIASDLPAGSGLSSSAALELAFLRVLMLAAGWRMDAVTAARLATRAEREFAGVDCGIMDQLASAAGRRGRALCLDCATGAFDLVDIPSSASWLVFDSGVRRELGDGRYNLRRAEVDRAAQMLGVSLPRLAGLEPSTVAARALPEPLAARARHVVEESRRALTGAQCLRDGDLESLGALLNDSHRSLRDGFEVSTPELDQIQAAAVDAGALGARLLGAGFGGSVLALTTGSSAAGVAAAATSAGASGWFAASPVDGAFAGSDR